MSNLPPIRARYCLALLCFGAAAFGAPANVREKRPAVAPYAVTAVRFWSLTDVTRIAIETTGDFEYNSDRVPNPDRIFFDLQGTYPEIGDHALSTIPVNDHLLKAIRVAETRKGVTRVVLDLAAEAEFSTSRLTNPERLIIELHKPGVTPRRMMSPDDAALAETRKFTPPPSRALAVPPLRMPIIEPPSLANAGAPALAPTNSALVARLEPKSFVPPYHSTIIVPRSTLERPLRNLPPQPSPVVRVPQTAISVPEPEIAAPARRDSEGDRSMIRALDLKLGTVVLDAGHGGHDTGTIGPTGLMEKDLVLDVTQRLGRLITQRLGVKVVYTRSDDTFIPLDQRTRIANEAHADLFLSIHANSSPLRNASGVETYYLNFTTSKAALDVAARENAGSQINIGELQQVIQKIALHEKVDESREFANSIQNALYATSRHLDSHSRDRGVRKAPFVVLIGASMPSVLAEIGFVSNLQDERLLRREEQRERIAEALYRGLAQYAGGLSHFQVAERTKPREQAAR
ncbi:MAG TPA: N-acetylmuramoyl-L-alanine amidase [Bryobacteraceae bacterium]|nr:N-acetylmuramoyl-L-alanine amidase [Bryobacteraceae bacterium]